MVGELLKCTTVTVRGSKVNDQPGLYFETFLCAAAAHALHLGDGRGTSCDFVFERLAFLDLKYSISQWRVCGNVVWMDWSGFQLRFIWLIKDRFFSRSIACVCAWSLVRECLLQRLTEMSHSNWPFMCGGRRLELYILFTWLIKRQRKYSIVRADWMADLVIVIIVLVCNYSKTNGFLLLPFNSLNKIDKTSVMRSVFAWIGRPICNQEAIAT